jgi:hypothetical protein
MSSEIDANDVDIDFAKIIVASLLSIAAIVFFASFAFCVARRRWIDLNAGKVLGLYF